MCPMSTGEVEEEVWCECSDDETYNPGRGPKGTWQPKAEDMLKIFEEMKSKKVLELSWKCPGRRPPESEKKEEEIKQEVIEMPQKPEEKKPVVPNEFDFSDDFAEAKTILTPRRTPGSAPKAPKVVARMDKVLKDMMHQRKVQAAEREAKKLAKAQRNPGSPSRARIGSPAGSPRTPVGHGNRQSPVRSVGPVDGSTPLRAPAGSQGKTTLSDASSNSVFKSGETTVFSSAGGNTPNRPLSAGGNNPNRPLSSGDKTQSPRMPPSSGERTQSPRMPSAAGERTQSPRMPPSSGERTQSPRMPPSSGERTQSPRMPSTAGERTQSPRMAPSAGERTQSPRTLSLAGERTQSPRMPSVAGERTQSPRTLSSSGERAQSPRMPPSGGERTQSPRMQTYSRTITQSPTLSRNVTHSPTLSRPGTQSPLLSRAVTQSPVQSGPVTQPGPVASDKEPVSAGSRGPSSDTAEQKPSVGTESMDTS